MDHAFDNAAADVVRLLHAHNHTVAVCESISGGLLGAKITQIPGSSAVFRGGLITYATDLKHSLAGVNLKVLTTYGPVAKATAIEMAQGARLRCDADYGVSLTGVAGPSPQDGHEIGEVWVGISKPDGSAAAFQAHSLLGMETFLTGNRHEIREKSVHAALLLLSEALNREFA
ncbi:CinA family protein [Corynebacterium sp. HS2168-gen11]|uniref:CinA family protein n=1 Tax=Corynebacterium sp. HS2168-gen11 TaxID=2974027 RepID=UPI00216AEC13|nr:CinA family protein [Corynebacterium sp. HS2168-gen11]MCS4536340.1 CinA family protein [Corynebacterium sp. HS2168-gen11]